MNRARISWPAAMASVTAFAALGMTGHRVLIPSVLAAAVLLAAAVRARMPAGAALPWLARAIFWTVVIVANINEPVDDTASIYDPKFVQTVGELCAVELAIQAWRPRPAGGPGGAFVVLLSAIVFVAACHRSDYSHPRELLPTYLHYLAPVYMLFLALTLRRLGGAGLPGLPGRGRRRTPVLAAGAMVAIALGTGCGTSILVHRYRDAINSASMELMQRFMDRSAEVGFSGAPSLGSHSGMTRSLARVLRVEGPLADPHIRGMAFEAYGRGRWTPTLENRRFEPLAVSALSPDAPGLRLRFTRYVDQPGVLFVPLDVSGVAPRGVDVVEWDGGQDSCIRVAAPAPYVYECALAPEGAEPGPLARPPWTEQRQRCLHLPSEIDPRVGDLAREIAREAGAAGAEATATAIARYLQTNHRYSLSNDVRSSEGDPVSNFLLKRKAAHCEYFASAAVMLLRALGVPARYVVGYYVHEWAGPQTWTVREQDAHAWCEAYADRGWITVDGTPAEGTPEATADAPSLARRLWERLRDMANAAWAGLADQGSAHLGFLVVGGASAAIVLRGALELLRRRRRAGAWAYASPAPEFIQIAERFEALLERKGVACPPGRTWREHLALLAAPDSPVRPTIDLDRARDLERAYTRARFGAPGDAAALATIAETLRELERR